MLEEQLEVGITEEVEQTISVCQSNHSTLPTLLEHRVDEHTCMGLNIRLEEVILIAHFSLYMIIMSHVQCVILQLEKTVVMIPAQYTCSCPSSWTREYYGYLMAERSSHHRSTFECVDRYPQSVPGSIANTDGALFYHTEVRCNYGIPCPSYDAQKEVMCVVCTK